jgi:glycosyltransferase involved in cell wall biosynthesis
MNRPLYFVLPDMEEIPSGGNLYNAHLIGALRQLRPEVVVVDWPDYLDLRQAGKPGIFWIDTLFLDAYKELPPHDYEQQREGLIVHHLESLYPPRGYSSEDWYDHREAEVLKRFSCFLATSTYTRDYLQAKGFASQQIIVAPPALGMPPQARATDTHELRALMVSNLVERKGILPFLEALARLWADLGPFSLTLVGSDEIEPEYAHACHQLMAEHPELATCIHLTGALLPQKTNRYFRFSNLYLSTAFMETYGMALQEARSFRLPILALNRGNVSAHVRGNGKLFDSLEELVDCFVSLTRHPDAFKRLHDQALHCCTEDHADWNVVANQLIAGLKFQTWTR